MVSVKGLRTLLRADSRTRQRGIFVPEIRPRGEFRRKTSMSGVGEYNTSGE